MDPRKVRAATDSLLAAGLDVTRADALVAELIGAATQLEDARAKRGWGDHRLCQLLADTADALDPQVLAAATASAFEGALVAEGVPLWVASLAGAGIAQAAATTLTSAMPTAQLCVGLRVLGVLVCPNPNTCQVQSGLLLSITRTALSVP